MNDELKKEAEEAAKHIASGMELRIIDESIVVEVLGVFIDRATLAERKRWESTLVDAGYAIETIRGYIDAGNKEQADKHLTMLSQMLLATTIERTSL